VDCHPSEIPRRRGEIRRPLTAKFVSFHADVREEFTLPDFQPDLAIEQAVHIRVEDPLRPRRFYRRSKVVSGYFVHFAVDQLVHPGSSKIAHHHLRVVLSSRADVHARAKLGTGAESCCVTAIHMAAHGNSVLAVSTLLRFSASIESAASLDTLPCWTPLADAIMASQDENAGGQPARSGVLKDSLVQVLLSERANPDGCGGSGGLSCLHLAVGKVCTPGVVELLCALECRCDSENQLLRASV
jgi:hypothetical protein